MTSLESLAALADREGWAEDSGDIKSVRRQASALGWEEVSPRRGDPAVSVLRPVSQLEARPRSLSAKIGLGVQPLHTDGAHLPDPPDILVLISEESSSTPTLLLRPRANRGFSGGLFAAACHGMFLVNGGRDSFFAPALSEGRYRYDPGCMSPCDARAQSVVDYFGESLKLAHAHDWLSGGRLLIVNNRRTLHARTSLTDGDEHRSLHRIAFRTGRDE